MREAPTLIDAYLPVFDVRERHETRVRANPARAFAALRDLDWNRSRVVRALFALRTLPERLQSRGPRPDRAETTFLEMALSAGWKILEEIPNEELVAGAVTQPWEPVVHFRGMSGDAFRAFAEPGFAKIAWSFAARPAGEGFSLVRTETRVATTDPRSRRRFRRYWRIFSPFIGLIRILALRLVRRDLDRMPPTRGV